MKRFISAILIVLIVFCLTSCSMGQQTQTSTFVIPNQGGEAGGTAQETQESDTKGEGEPDNETATVTSSSSGGSAASSQGSSSQGSSSHSSSSQASSSQSSVSDGELIPSVWDYAKSYQYNDPATSQNIYYLFHTPARNTGKSYPLIIFLHGLGGRVDTEHHGTAAEFIYSLTNLENESDKYSTYTLIPSTPLANEGWWTEAQITAFKNLINDLIKNHNIDPKRIYITGISMGGFTTCRLVNEMPGFFAAAVPLSGASNLSNPQNHFNTAFYIYHAENDTTVSPDCSRKLYNQLKSAGHPKANYTEFPGGDHTKPLYSVYIEGYYTFFNWLFAQRLP